MWNITSSISVSLVRSHPYYPIFSGFGFHKSSRICPMDWIRLAIRTAVDSDLFVYTYDLVKYHKQKYSKSQIRISSMCPQISSKISNVV